MDETIRGKQIDNAYIAGFVDGEGCIGIYKRKPESKRWSPRYYAQVFVVNTNLEVLQWIQEIYRGSIHEKKRYSDKHRKAYVLFIRNKNMERFLEEIHPYLKVKRKNADLILKFIKRLGKVKPNYGKTKQCLSRKELEIREAFYQQSHQLNFRSRRD